MAIDKPQVSAGAQSVKLGFHGREGEHAGLMMVMFGWISLRLSTLFTVIENWSPVDRMGLLQHAIDDVFDRLGGTRLNPGLPHVAAISYIRRPCPG